MKALKIWVIAGGLMAAASHKKSDPITGTYVTSFKNEYSIANDTMIITSFNQAQGTFKVERRDGFHRIRDGSILPKEFRQEHWMATYDRDRHLLQETAYGRQIYFNDDGQSLNYNGTYQKIK